MGFLTFDSTLHFYNLKPGLTQPQSLVVSELDEPFLPLPDDMLVNLSESREVGGWHGRTSLPCFIYLFIYLNYRSTRQYQALLPCRWPFTNSVISHM